MIGLFNYVLLLSAAIAIAQSKNLCFDASGTQSASNAGSTTAKNIDCDAVAGAVKGTCAAYASKDSNEDNVWTTKFGCLPMDGCKECSVDSTPRGRNYKCITTTNSICCCCNDARGGIDDKPCNNIDIVSKFKLTHKIKQTDITPPNSAISVTARNLVFFVLTIVALFT